MELLDLIKKQEAQSRISLTDDERRTVVTFFEERNRELSVLDTVNPRENAESTVSTPSKTPLREDVASPEADRERFLSQAPDRDGGFVRVPRTL